MSGESIWLSRYAGGVSLFVRDAGCIQIDQLLYSGFCTLQNISCSDRQRALSQLQKQMNWNISSLVIRSSWLSWSNSNPYPERSSSSSSVSLWAASSSSPSSSPSSASTAAGGPTDQEVRKCYRAFFLHIFYSWMVRRWQARSHNYGWLDKCQRICWSRFHYENVQIILILYTSKDYI